MSKKLCVIGLGYIGLPTAVMFANHGFQVHGVDVNKHVIEMVAQKELPIEEPGLLERLEKAIDSGAFTVSLNPEEADVFIIAVPSPINPDKSANLTYVKAASEAIAPYLKKGNLVILESTVPPRTVVDIVIPALQTSRLVIGEDLFVSHSPERVIPGKLFEELVNNDRIVGGINEQSSKMTEELYKTFVKGTIHITDATTAEMVKVMENTYRDINIAFANELAKISEKIGINVWEAINLANFHPRVNIHTPGPGVGGHCIAVDPWFLVDLAPEEAQLIKHARTINDGMPSYTVALVEKIIKEKGIHRPKVAVFGLAFKGNIDDMRESPSTDVIAQLEKANIAYSVYDPHIKENKVAFQTQNFEEAIEHVDLILILTDHQAFKELDPQMFATKVRSQIVLDAKRVVDLEKWQQAGFEAFLLGNGKEK